MTLGLHERKLAPDAFWNATLRELLPVKRLSPLRRDHLHALMAAFPD